VIIESNHYTSHQAYPLFFTCVKVHLWSKFSFSWFEDNFSFFSRCFCGSKKLNYCDIQKNIYSMLFCFYRITIKDLTCTYFLCA
jgi:hypothetical protein